MTSSWISYNELAWADDWLASPSDYENETRVYIDLLKASAASPPRTLLHLGSGGGGHDTVFKRHFEVTGVDLSQGMLERARAAHPDIEYIEGDMRTVRLNRRFDAVVIPDSIDYMVTRDDLRQALVTAAVHLDPGGVLLVVAKPEETFRNNNFAYTGERDGVHLTLLENNHVDPSRPGSYQAVFVYLVRRQGELTIHTEIQELGLFPRAAWQEAFDDAGFAMRAVSHDGVYDSWLLGDGAYPLTVFVGTRT